MDSQLVQARQNVSSAVLCAARDGRSFRKWVNEKVSVNAQTVLTDSTLLLNLEHGKRYLITSLYLALNTQSDSVEAQLGVTSEANGGGEFTAKTMKFEIVTGTTGLGITPIMMVLSVPICVTQDDGRSFTARVTTNDAGAEITLGFDGWEEDDR